MDAAQMKFKGRMIVRALYSQRGVLIKSLDAIKPGSMVYASKRMQTPSPVRNNAIKSQKRDSSAQSIVKNRSPRLPNTPFSRQGSREKSITSPPWKDDNALFDKSPKETKEIHKIDNSFNSTPDKPARLNISPQNEKALPKESPPNKQPKILTNNRNSNTKAEPKFTIQQDFRRSAELKTNLNKNISPTEKKIRAISHARNSSVPKSFVHPMFLRDFDSPSKTVKIDSVPHRSNSSNKTFRPKANESPIQTNGFAEFQNIIPKFKMNESTRRKTDYGIDKQLIEKQNPRGISTAQSFANSLKLTPEMRPSAQLNLNDKSLKNVTASFSTLHSIESAIEALSYFSPKNESIYGVKQANIESDDDDEDAIYTSHQTNQNKKNNEEKEEKDDLDEFKDSDDSNLFSSSTEEKINILTPLQGGASPTSVPLKFVPTKVGDVQLNLIKSPPKLDNSIIRIQNKEGSPMQSPEKLDQFMESDDDFLSFGSNDDINDQIDQPELSGQTAPLMIKPIPIRSAQTCPVSKYDYSQSDDYEEEDHSNDKDNDNYSLDNILDFPIPSSARRRSDIQAILPEIRRKEKNLHHRSNSRTSDRGLRLTAQSITNFERLQSSFVKTSPRIPKKPNVPNITQRKSTRNKKSNKYNQTVESLIRSIELGPKSDEEIFDNLIDTACNNKPQEALGLSPEAVPSILLPEIEKQQASAWIAHGCLIACLELFPDVDDSTYGKEQIISKSKKILSNHRFSNPIGSEFHIRAAITGMKRSGKSTFLRILTDQLISELVFDGTWHKTFLFMLNMEKLVSSINSPEKFYTTIVHSTLHHLSWHKPIMHQHMRKLILFFDSVITNKHTRHFPHLNDETIENELKNLGTYLFNLWNTPTEYRKFMTAAVFFPSIIANIFQFQKTLFILDHYDVIHTFSYPSGETSNFNPNDGFWLTDICNYAFTSTDFIIASDDLNKFYECTSYIKNIEIYGTMDLIDKLSRTNLFDNYFAVQIEGFEEPIILTIDSCGGVPYYFQLWENMNSTADLLYDYKNQECELALNEAAKEFLEAVLVNENGLSESYNIISVHRSVRRSRK